MITPDAPAQGTAPVRPGTPLAICVFGGARMGRNAVISAAARQVGELIAQRGHRLVYGAGGSGLMGEVAWSAQRNGAAVTGYVPRFIHARERRCAIPEQTLCITEDLFERKRRMIEQGDAIIALPGGYGTLDEVLDVLAMACLRVSTKPLILLNTENFWSGLMALAESLYHAGFAERHPGALLRTAGSPVEAIAMAEQAVNAGDRTPAGIAR